MAWSPCLGVMHGWARSEEALLLQELDRSGTAVSPLRFLGQMRTLFPQFAQQTQGHYMQQDAEECWSQLLYVFREQLKVSAPFSGPAELPQAYFGQRAISSSGKLGRPTLPNVMRRWLDAGVGGGDGMRERGRILVEFGEQK